MIGINHSGNADQLTLANGGALVSMHTVWPVVMQGAIFLNILNVP